MKKVLTITLVMILILSFSKVKAMSLDGILDREIATGPNDYSFHLYEDATNGANYKYEQEFDFDVPFTPNGATYAVFPIEGIAYTIGTLNVSDFQVKVYLKSDKNYAMCEIQNNLITCGLDQARTYTGIKMWIRSYTAFQTGNKWEIDYRVNRNVSLYKTDTQTIIDNQNQNYNDFKNQNATYTDEINTNMNGANETIQYSQNEEQLLDSLDMNTSILDNININVGASTFIWDIVEGVRGMNPAIITLMTSILGLGIAKMILNR